MHNIDSGIEFTYMYGQTLITLCSSSAFNSLTPKISLVMFLTVFHTIHMILVEGIWYWINFLYLLIDIFLYFHYLCA